MARFRDMIRVEVVAGEPITVGETTITPQAWVLAFRWPGGGWVWNRPHAVLVERNGQVERVPIVDLTRVARWSMLSLGVGLWLLAAVLRRRRTRRERGERGDAPETRDLERRDDDVGAG